jgi:HEAT repeat protein
VKLGSWKLLLLTPALLAASSFALAETPQEQAWRILQTGAAERSPEARVTAIGALGLVLRNPQAAAIVEKALEDEKPEVRAASAHALGQMLYAPSISKLRKALTDKEDSVVAAAAQALIRLKDPAGYELYYSVLTGERKKGQGLISRGVDLLRDPKKVAEFSLKEAIGFLPYGAYGLSAVEFIEGQERDVSYAKAVAAKFLADDPDPQSGEALARAVSNRSWLVRESALEAIAKRADPSLLTTVQAAMSDEKDRVRYQAAAAVLRLTDVHLSKNPRK